MNFDFSVLNFTVCHVYHIYVIDTSNLHCSLSLLIECWIFFFLYYEDLIGELVPFFT